MSVGRVARVGGVVVAVLATAACQSSQETSTRDAAARFDRALADHDGRAACDLLTPAARSELEQSSGTACDGAVLDELGNAEGTPTVVVYGTMAQARYSNDTRFLTRFGDGWRVMAAGCVPAASELYDCAVDGG